MHNAKIQTLSRKDHQNIRDLYLKTYHAQGENRTAAQIKPFLDYLLKRPLKLKLVLDGKIIWGFISDIKPRHTWNMLFDPELFIDPDHQQSGFWTFLLQKSFEIAQKQYQATDIVSFTFPDSYQLKRYQRLGMKTDNYWQMLYGDLTTLITQLKK